MKTQRERILAVLMERGEKGVYVYELMTPRPTGLGCAQYNARIKELRGIGYTIVNTEPGHFVLKDNPINTQKLEHELLTYEQLKAELQTLREVWEIAPTNDKKRIATQGMMLKEMVDKMEALI